MGSVETLSSCFLLRALDLLSSEYFAALLRDFLGISFHPFAESLPSLKSFPTPRLYPILALHSYFGKCHIIDISPVGVVDLA